MVSVHINSAEITPPGSFRRLFVCTWLSAGEEGGRLCCEVKEALAANLSNAESKAAWQGSFQRSYFK